MSNATLHIHIRPKKLWAYQPCKVEYPISLLLHQMRKRPCCMQGGKRSVTPKTFPPRLTTDNAKFNVWTFKFKNSMQARQNCHNIIILFPLICIVRVARVNTIVYIIHTLTQSSWGACGMICMHAGIVTQLVRGRKERWLLVRWLLAIVVTHFTKNMFIVNRIVAMFVCSDLFVPYISR
jgi:hypothetical protein